MVEDFKEVGEEFKEVGEASKEVGEGDSEILRMGKWVWILHRASENKKEQRRGVGRN